MSPETDFDLPSTKVLTAATVPAGRNSSCTAESIPVVRPSTSKPPAAPPTAAPGGPPTTNPTTPPPMTP
ncbi:hypothetical protein GBAR_LOCUS19819, partial [Geodia barretti]